MKFPKYLQRSEKNEENKWKEEKKDESAAEQIKKMLI